MVDFFFFLEHEHHLRATAGAAGRRPCSLRRCRHSTRKVVSCVDAGRVVVILIDWLHQLHPARVTDTVSELLCHTHVPDNKRSGNQHDEKNKHGEIKDGIADNTTSSKLGLLQGINRWTDLPARRISAKVHEIV